MRTCTERSEAAVTGPAKHPLLQLLYNGSTFIEGVLKEIQFYAV